MTCPGFLSGVMILDIRKRLYELADRDYLEFQSKLIPGKDGSNMIGVRTPVLRSLAKELIRSGDAEDFINVLPHGYYDENNLHAFIISEIRDFGKCVSEVDRFLPFVDNWATCDQLRPKVFAKRRKELLPHALRWISSDDVFTKRFGIGMLMCHFLDEEFRPEYLDIVASVKSEERYIKLMAAWYFATALAKQYEDAVKILEEGRLDDFTHDMTIKKAKESFRVTGEQKEYLDSLKRT